MWVPLFLLCFGDFQGVGGYGLGFPVVSCLLDSYSFVRCALSSIPKGLGTMAFSEGLGWDARGFSYLC